MTTKAKFKMTTQYNDTLAIKTIGRKTIAIIEKNNDEKQVIVFTRTQTLKTCRYLLQKNYIGTISEGFQIAALIIT